jgi:hypothetical protein
MEEETHKLTPGMKNFFSRLLDIKTFIRDKAENSSDKDWMRIYKDLDTLFKPKEIHQ